MEDAIFYPAVLERMKTDHRWHMMLSGTFHTLPREKDRQRSFGYRAYRWLKGRIDGMEWSTDDYSVQPDLATWPALEREVFDLMTAHLIAAGKNAEIGAVAVPAALAPQTAPGWHDLVADMQAALASMATPDEEMARSLLALAEELIVACEIATSEAETSSLIANRKQALAAGVSWLAQIVDAVPILTAIDQLATADTITQTEALVSALATARNDFAAAEAAMVAAETYQKQVAADPNATRPEIRAALDAADVAEAKESEAKQGLHLGIKALAEALQGWLTDASDAPDHEPVPIEEPQAVPLKVAALQVTQVFSEPDTTLIRPAAADHVAEPPVDADADQLQQCEPEPVTAPSVSAATQIFEDSAYGLPSQTDPVVPTSLDEGTTEEPAIWSGRQTCDDVMTHFIVSDELALAYHLAELTEERGLRPPVASGLLKALVASRVLTGPYDAIAQTLGERLAAAMTEVEKADAEGPAASLRARSVALAALLRPALLARDTNARDHLGNLTLADGLSGFAPVVALLRELRRDLQPSLADLRELAGGEMQRRLPAALAALRGWLPGARKAQALHAPTSIILHKFLDTQGALGSLFEAAIAGQIEPLEAASGFLLALSTDKRAAETMVAEAEREIGRQKRDAIRGTALDWIVRKLREGADLLLDWRAAFLEEQTFDDRRKATLERFVNELRKELTRARRESPAEEGIDAAVQRLLDREIADMQDVVQGRSAHGTGGVTRLSEALEAALLRLPGLCQPYAPDDPPYDTERRAQRQTLYLALQRPDSLIYDEIGALAAHLAAHAVLPARALVRRLERQGRLTAAEVTARLYDLENASHTAREGALRAIAGLRHDLEPLQSIDLVTSPEIQLWLDRFGLITAALFAEEGIALPLREGQRSPAIPPDFPHLAQVLDEARALRDRTRDGIRSDQRRRLETLGAKLRARGDDRLADEAELVSADLASRDPITVEDILIRLQNGQSFSLSNVAQDDHFASFYPGFVSALVPEIDAVAIKTAIQNGGAAGPLDYARLEEHDSRRALELDEKWRTVANAFRSNRDIGPSLRTFMERLGFTSVAIERETQLSAQLRWMWMRANPLSAQDWFLPPVFGSEARGSYPVFLAHRGIEDAQLVAELAKAGRDAPCLLLIFGRLSKARRESFGLAMRKAKQTVLLIDETQILYLTTGGNWMERLFACATPFGYLQPFTTSPGNIPVEMFFGRETEISKIEGATADGCLVYGGRQLGKSALLHHVRKRFHQPHTGRHAYYLKIDEFGGQVHPAKQIWSEIRRALSADAIVPKTSDKPEDIRSGILDWLARGGERRILLLVDEADMFLASEARSGFPNLNPLKDLMEETERRFKVVFAGLHNVRRMAKAPNSPLVHLSEPICIGPLNTSAESSQQARRLVVEPMRAAGFDYEKPDLVHALLTRVNFYPSLMQVFLKALLEGLSNQARPQGAGPRWILKEEQLFRGPSSEGINSQIRDRFQWTLNLDPRYELIAKVLARHRILSVDADGGAMAAEDLRLETEIFWPKGQEKLGRVDFPAFLDEMVDLGVLIRLPGPRGLYGLRGAQVAQMLGQLDLLEDEILKIAEKEPRVDYDPNHYHRRAGFDHSDRRAPLPDRAMAALFNTSAPGVRILIAAPAILGGDQVQILADLAAGWNDDKGRLTSEVFRGQDDDLRRIVDRVTGRKVLVIQAQGAKATWLDWLANHPAVKDGKLVPVVVGAPDAVGRLLPRGIPDGMLCFRSKPWERTMLRAWLSDSGLTLLDAPDTRDALLKVTGGAPAALFQIKQGLEAFVAGGRRDDMATRLEELGRGIAFSPAQIGLRDPLVPLFCDAAELVEGQNQEAEATLIELLSTDLLNAAQEIANMTDLGLFVRPEPEVIALSPLGVLLYNACNAPRTAG